MDGRVKFRLGDQDLLARLHSVFKHHRAARYLDHLRFEFVTQ